jgi:hypothetical protein
LRNCLVGLLGTPISTPTTTRIPTLTSTRIPTLMGTQATRVPDEPGRWPFALVRALRYVGVPPASPLGRGSDAGRSNAVGNWVTPAQREVDRGRHDLCGYAAIPKFQRMASCHSPIISRHRQGRHLGQTRRPVCRRSLLGQPLLVMAPRTRDRGLVVCQRAGLSQRGHEQAAPPPCAPPAPPPAAGSARCGRAGSRP